MTKKTIAILTEKLKYMQELLTRYVDDVNHIKDRAQEPKVQHIISRLPNLESEYLDCWFELSAEDAVSDLTTPASFTETCEDLQFSARNLLQSWNIPREGVNREVQAPRAQATSLPTLQLPMFSGNICDYMSFIENFKTVVDASSIGAVQKLLYLRSSLRGEALQCISGVAVTDANYAIALGLLKDRYHKPKLIVRAHINNIFNLENVTKNSSSSLQSLLDTLSKNLSGLKQSNIEQESLADALLYHIIESKLDAEGRDCLRKHHVDKLMTTDELVEFLRNRVSNLTYIGASVSTASTSTNFRRKQLTLVGTSNGRACPLCSGAHNLHRCDKFAQLSPSERADEVKRMRVCWNCLSHPSTVACKSKFKCAQCNRKHHTLLHFPRVENRHTPHVTSENVSEVPLTPQDRNTEPISLACTGTSQILLSTVLVDVFDAENNAHQVRCLLDSGSMHNIMSSHCASKLRLATTKTGLQISGIGGKTTNITSLVNVTISSRTTRYSQSISCYVIERIAATVPTVTFSPRQVNIPANIKLADPQFYKAGEIDLLIGAEHFYDLLCVGQIRLAPHMPILQKTVFGYILSGRINHAPVTNSFSNSSVLTCCTEQCPSDAAVQKFWEIEQCLPRSQNSLLSPEHRLCEEHFSRTISRDEFGRFSVSILFKQPELRQLGDSHEIALRRFNSLERRLNKNPILKSQYVNFIKEYKDLKHLTVIQPKSVRELNFLPHHEVLKSSSTTTKLRVVFDGSVKTTTGISINDCQYSGPVVQSDLLSILLNFRCHRVAITGDCEKMYRQIWLSAEQRKHQCILWRERSCDDVQVLQLNTVTYGLTSSSYLATKCIQHLATINLEKHPTAAGKMLTDFYVDDFISGADSEADALKVISEVSQILGQAGFPLRKIHSNIPSISQRETAELNFKEASSSTLGISWLPHSDLFQFKVALNFLNKEITKRQIFSEISKLFDPMGLISPVIIKGKLIMQNVWKLGMSWDETLPMSVYSEYTSLTHSLSQVPLINIPRFILDRSALKTEIHGFCDASTRAYGACLYVRAYYSNCITVHLLCSKSRVAPLKPITLPRLELLGAVLLSELYTKVSSTLKLDKYKAYFWSDSTVTLHWINSDPNRYKTFVANRIATIQEQTNLNSWHHCISQDNPADLISRGCSLTDHSNVDFWFHGPKFLKDLRFLPVPFQTNKSESLPEEKRVQVSLIVCKEDTLYTTITKISGFLRLQRIFAYVRRFICNSRTTADARQTGELTVNEMLRAAEDVVYVCQRVSFGEEFKELQSERPYFKKSSYFASLSPFIDSRGLIRVGGRIRNAHIPASQAHPMLLPKNNPLTRSIATYYHQANLHCGPNHLLSLMRQTYWPIAGRALCRKIVYDCVRCFRNKPKMLFEKMGDLPSCRITQGVYCFSNTGVDFAGPIMLKDRQTRRPTLIKAYIALFICMVTRAVHLELVTSLSSQDFIETFKRFIARRGKPSHMYSDNATNFTAAAREISELYTSFDAALPELQQFMLSEAITWHFIPPSSPHHGGVWESNIKSTKICLNKILGGANLTFERMYTILVQIEAILNSRPLSPMSSSPNDFAPLTPSHFLLGRPMTGLPGSSLEDLPENRLDAYQHRQLLVGHFWKRWSREVLPEMQRRLKWASSAQQLITLGSLVLCSEPNTPPYRWPLCRVVALHPGADQKVRVVSIKTASGSVYKRPITKICVLPVSG